MFYCNWGFGSGPGGFMGGMMGGFGSIFGLLILGTLIYLVVRLFTNRPASSSGAKQDKVDSREILKRKFASGEISEEEYQNIRKILDT